MQGLGKTVSVTALILSDPGGPRRDWPLRRGPDTAPLHQDAAEGGASDAAALDVAATALAGDSGEEEPHAASPQAREVDHSGCVGLAMPGPAGEVERRRSDRVAADPSAEDCTPPGMTAAAPDGESEGAGSAEAGAAEERALPGGTLVVVPKSIMSQWVLELHDKARPRLSCLTLKPLIGRCRPAQWWSSPSPSCRSGRWSCTTRHAPVCRV